MFLFQSCTWHEPAPLKLNDFNDDLADLRKSTVANKVNKNESKEIMHRFLGGGNSNIFLCSPRLFGEMIQSHPSDFIRQFSSGYPFDIFGW